LQLCRTKLIAFFAIAYSALGGGNAARGGIRAIGKCKDLLSPCKASFRDGTDGDRWQMPGTPGILSEYIASVRRQRH